MTFTANRGVPALPRPCLMLVTDGASLDDNALADAVAQAVDGGVNAVQQRDKSRRATAVARRLREITNGRSLLLINTWTALARGVSADGVHLPENEPFPDDANGLLAGRSVHSLDAALRAQREGVAYLIVGPVYESPSHPGVPGAGLDVIRRICEAVTVPVLGIGGIDYQRAPAVMEAGAVGVAVISAILGSSDPRGAAERLWNALRGSGG